MPPKPSTFHKTILVCFKTLPTCTSAFIIRQEFIWNHSPPDGNVFPCLRPGTVHLIWGTLLHDCGSWSILFDNNLVFCAGYMESFSWDSYLMKQSATAAPENLFSRSPLTSTPSDGVPPTNMPCRNHTVSQSRGCIVHVQH